MIWYSLSVSVSAGATVTESPVWMPIGSTFSMEQTMMQLSALVADHFHLVLLPAEHRFLDQHLVGRRGFDAAGDDRVEFVAVVGDAAAGAGKREGRSDDGRQAGHFQRLARFFQIVGERALRRFEPDAVHRLAEQQAVLGLVDRLLGRADHFDVEFLEHALAGQRQRGVERGLAAHGGQQRVGPLALDDLGHHVGRDRLDIRGIRQPRVGHDRRRVGVDQDDPVALRLERLARLHAGIIELARLADDDRAGADDEDGFDIGALRHLARFRKQTATPSPLAGEGRGGGKSVARAGMLFLALRSDRFTNRLRGCLPDFRARRYSRSAELESLGSVANPCAPHLAPL